MGEGVDSTKENMVGIGVKRLVRDMKYSDNLLQLIIHKLLRVQQHN